MTDSDEEYSDEELQDELDELEDEDYRQRSLDLLVAAVAALDDRPITADAARRRIELGRQIAAMAPLDRLGFIVPILREQVRRLEAEWDRGVREEKQHRAGAAGAAGRRG